MEMSSTWRLVHPVCVSRIWGENLSLFKRGFLKWSHSVPCTLMYPRLFKTDPNDTLHHDDLSLDSLGQIPEVLRTDRRAKHHLVLAWQRHPPMIS